MSKFKKIEFYGNYRNLPKSSIKRKYFLDSKLKYGSVIFLERKNY